MLEHSIDIQLKHPDDSFSLFGSNERHLRLMEQELGVVIHARTEKVQVIGQEEHVEQARLVIQSLLVLVSRGLVINTPDVVTAISMAKMMRLRNSLPSMKKRLSRTTMANPFA